MLARDFDFHLPPELIAQTPAVPRDRARLMRLQCATADVTHHIFHELPDLLRPDDLLVFNDTRVLRARLRGTKMLPDGTHGAQVEALLLREVEANLWEAMLRPSARLRPGICLEFVAPAGEVRVEATPVERRDETWTIRFAAEEADVADIRDLLPQLGEVPLPPYIESRASEESDYQTVYARERDAERKRANELESAAAPTAGLHFTPELLQALEARGIRTAFVTLGIGIGTFRPMKTENVEEHVMHSEEFEVSAQAAQVINEQKARGGRVVAVGTTTTRVLESAVDEKGQLRAGFGATSIFIKPGHQFRLIDALITNFHLPKSTLLVMISALAQHLAAKKSTSPSPGLPLVLKAYNEAVAERYRFFSFGDAMLIE